MTRCALTLIIRRSAEVATIAAAMMTPHSARAQAFSANAEPAGRRHADAVFHPVLGEVVLVGGAPARSAADPAAFDDIWSWDGSRWRLLARTGTPQMCGRVAFDSKQRRLLLQGGSAMSRREMPPQPSAGTVIRQLPNGWWVEDHGQLRELVDSTWRVIDASADRTFCTHVAFHDASADRLVVLGRPANGDPDTWEFDGRSWRRLATRPGSILSFQTFAFDTQRRRGVLVSGYTTAGLSADTYEFDGRDWSVVARGGPAPRLGAAAAFDESAGRTIVYGGENASGTLLTDTWSWNGTAWSLLTSDGPGPFDFPAMAYDQRRKVTVLFGMRPEGGPIEVWEFGRAWTRIR